MRRILPDEIVGKGTRNRAMMIIGIVLALVLLINFGAYQYLKYNTPNLGHEINVRKWGMLVENKESIDWLILGDSTCNQGIDPIVVERELGGESINFCTIGSLLSVNDAWMLDYYIKKQGAPKGIIVMHAYDVLDRSEISLSSVSQLPLGDIISNNLSPWPFTKRDVAMLYVYKYFPLCSQTASLTESISGAFYRLKDSASANRNFTKTGLMIETDPVPKNVEKDTREHMMYVDGKSFKVTNENLLGLERLAYLAEKYNFKVYYVPGPIHDELWNNNEFQRYFSEMDSFLSQFSNDHEQFQVVFHRPVAFSKNEMSSSDHVVGEAVEVLSRSLVEKINSLMK